MKPITFTQLLRPALVTLGAVSLFLGTGCQSTSTGSQPATNAGSASAAALAPATTNATLAANPRPVAVHDFAFDVAHLRTDQGVMAGREGPAKRVLGNLRPEETPAQKAARLAGLLSETIAQELTALKIPATREPQGTPWPATGLVVRGEFLQVDEGNRLKRAVVGFGAGATEALVQVEVYDLEQNREKPILVYGTGTGSKPTPGGIVAMNPYAMAAKYVLSRNATEKDVRHLGKQIAKDLAQVEAGALPKR
jgi:hypothetical protein